MTTRIEFTNSTHASDLAPIDFNNRVREFKLRFVSQWNEEYGCPKCDHTVKARDLDSALELTYCSQGNLYPEGGDRPDKLFALPSMSKGDVLIDRTDESNVKCYYCDTVGWTEMSAERFVRWMMLDDTRGRAFKSEWWG